MKRFFFFVFLGIIFHVCSAQNGYDADSLRYILKSNKQEDSNLAKTLLNLANIIIYSSPDSSMQYTDEAMSVSKKIKWQKGIALSLRQKGYVYYITSDYLRAMDYYLKALKAGEAINNEYFNATIYNNIANIYADLKDYKKALNYYSKYLSIAKEVKSKTDEMNGFINIGDVYTELDSLSLGLSYFNKALSLATETGNKRISAAIFNNLGEIAIKQNNYSDANTYFKRSLNLADETGNMNAKATALNGLGEIYLYQKNYGLAEVYSMHSLQLSKQLNNISWQANALETLSKTYGKKQDFAKALDAFKQKTILKDSISNDSKKQDINRLEMEYEYDKREDSIKAENDKKQALAVAAIKQEKIIKNFILSGAIAVILFSVFVFIFYKRRRDAVEKKHEAEFKAQALDIELKALRAQMNPHFIYNSLNSINDYIDKHDTVMATLYTTKFAKLMRMILENSEQKEIPLTDDLKALELYMQLESMRMKNKFSYKINVDEDIDQQNTLIPPLILQPFVENSIWHGISKKQGDGKIWITIHREGNMINCIVEDNGVGVRESANTVSNNSLEKRSLGMKITKARIDIINRIKKSNATITLSSLNEGTKIEVRLPEALAF